MRSVFLYYFLVTCIIGLDYGRIGNCNGREMAGFALKM